MAPPQPVVRYDFITALSRLQDTIETLSATKQQVAGPPRTRLGEGTPAAGVGAARMLTGWKSAGVPKSMTALQHDRRQQQQL